MLAGSAARGRHRAPRPVRRRKGDEAGVVAVVTALVVAAVLIPLTAVGLFAYTRSGTQGELKRAADAGVLAGATQIPLGNLGFAQTYAQASLNAVNGVFPVGNLDLTGTGLASLDVQKPLDIACNVAKQAAIASKGLSDTFVQKTGSAVTTADIGCVAMYRADEDFLKNLSQCAFNVAATTVPGTPVPGVPTLANLLPQLQNLLPALLHPGITVTLTWNVKGPIDAGVTGVKNSYKQQTTMSSAQRRFKNLVLLPSPTVTLPLVGAQTVDIASPLNQTTSALFTQLLNLESLLDNQIGVSSVTATVNQLLPGLVPPLPPAVTGVTIPGSSTLSSLLQATGCTSLLASFAADYSDVVNPQGNMTTPQQILMDTQAAGESVIALQIPDVSTLVGVNAPFFDFLNVCVPPGTPILGLATATSKATATTTTSPSPSPTTVLGLVTGVLGTVTGAIPTTTNIPVTIPIVGSVTVPLPTVVGNVVGVASCALSAPSAFRAQLVDEL